MIMIIDISARFTANAIDLCVTSESHRSLGIRH